jgi:hypothetical protein
MYGPPDGPMIEETPQRAQGKKGRTRIETADALLRAHADGKMRCTIGRSLPTTYASACTAVTASSGAAGASRRS